MLVGMQPLTIKRYRRAIRHFFSVLSLHGFTLPNSLVDLDETAGEYINHLYLDDYPLHDASCFVACMKRLFPCCRRHLETTTAWYQNWPTSVKQDRATPVSSELVIGMSVAALLEGEPRLALVLLLGFLGLLRTGEILKLKTKHLRIENEVFLVVTLFDTKAGRRKGQDEQVIIADPDVISLARQVVAQVRAEALILPWSWGRLARAIARLSAKPDSTVTRTAASVVVVTVEGAVVAVVVVAAVSGIAAGVARSPQVSLA